jgi:transposase InsO family protein
MLNVSRSSFYYQSGSLTKQIQDADLVDQIERIVAEFPCYGSRRVAAELKRRGQPVNRKRIQRLMRQEHLLCAVKKRWIATTQSDHGLKVYPNVAKDMIITVPNQLWVADITYIRILAGFIYLAVILDLFSRKAIGHALSRTLEKELCLSALRMALNQRQPPKGCTHHSDRGIQYASGDYVDLLKERGFVISMSAKGNPYDNAFAESFFKTLKYEEVHLWEYQTIQDVVERIPFFIEQVYNKKRLHSSLGYRPPEEFEAMHSNNALVLV